MNEQPESSGMVDIHSHILWELDDGAPDFDTSIAMLRVAAGTGTTDIVATPHMNEVFAYDSQLVSDRIRELNEKSAGILRVHKGCEFHLTFDNFNLLLESPKDYTINGKQYLLLECPDHHIGKHAEKIVGELLDSGIVPVIAHPERNPVLQRDPERLAAWINKGCLAQLTAMSITGAFGRSAASVAARFMERGFVHVVASDAHDPERRAPALDKARDLVESRFGTDAAELLFAENPRRIIEGLPVADGPMSQMQSRRWWQFWKSRSNLD